jgi:hypothetical protein
MSSPTDTTNNNTVAMDPQEDRERTQSISESSPVFGSSPSDRRMSAEWDASKVPPSRFQRRKGSIYAVPASRDGHIDNNYAHKYHEKLAEKGWVKSSDKKT